MFAKLKKYYTKFCRAKSVLLLAQYVKLLYFFIPGDILIVNIVLLLSKLKVINYND
jgi:hypothetical protein